MKTLLAIDPGANGGIAWVGEHGIVQAERMPDDCSELKQSITDWVLSVRLGDSYQAIIERTGTYIPGNSGVAAATFARHCGQIEGLLTGMGVPWSDVAPKEWQRNMGLSKDKKERKNQIKAKMQARYPHLKVTLCTADALAILTYAIVRN